MSSKFGAITGACGRSSIPEARVLEPINRGVLGRPVKPAMTDEDAIQLRALAI